MKKAMISQPMNGIRENEIRDTRNRAIRKLESLGYEVINTYFTGEWYRDENIKKRGAEHIGLYFLSKSLENMSKCDAVYFCKGWEAATGCKIEYEAAVAYGLKIIEE